ncbi:hypothetical protein YC2023_075342 [Brassica napus]
MGEIVKVHRFSNVSCCLYALPTRTAALTLQTHTWCEAGSSQGVKREKKVWRKIHGYRRNIEPPHLKQLEAMQVNKTSFGFDLSLHINFWKLPFFYFVPEKITG